MRHVSQLERLHRKRHQAPSGSRQQHRRNHEHDHQGSRAQGTGAHQPPDHDARIHERPHVKSAGFGNDAADGHVNHDGQSRVQHGKLPVETHGHQLHQEQGDAHEKHAHAEHRMIRNGIRGGQKHTPPQSPGVIPPAGVQHHQQNREISARENKRFETESHHASGAQLDAVSRQHPGDETIQIRPDPHGKGNIGADEIRQADHGKKNAGIKQHAPLAPHQNAGKRHQGRKIKAETDGNESVRKPTA